MTVPHNTVYLVDDDGSGHHAEYAATLAGQLILNRTAVSLVGTNDFLAAARRKGYAGPAIETSRDETFRVGLNHAAKHPDSRVLFLYLDWRIQRLWSLRKHTSIAQSAAILHWLPWLRAVDKRSPARFAKRKLEILQLRQLARLGTRFGIHSIRALPEMQSHLGASVRSIPYPVMMQDYPATPSSPAVKEDTTILCFGETRWDKGADLAIRTLAVLPIRYRLIIAGREDHFRRRELEGLIARYGVGDRVDLRLQRVPESDVVSLFQEAVILLLPYRRIFSGQSGPLFIAANLQIPVVATPTPLIAETIERYRLGAVAGGFAPGEIARAVLSVNDRGFVSCQGALADDHSPARFAAGINALLRGGEKS